MYFIHNKYLPYVQLYFPPIVTLQLTDECGKKKTQKNKKQKTNPNQESRGLHHL